VPVTGCWWIPKHPSWSLSIQKEFKMNTVTNQNLNTQDYLIADINQADFGRKEITIAETEMPGLMAIREAYGDSNSSAH
jgi:hypothetical protein